MAEQRAVVQLDTRQVEDLKAFVRSLVKERAGELGPQPGELEALKDKVRAMAEEYARDPRWLRSADVAVMLLEWINER